MKTLARTAALALVGALAGLSGPTIAQTTAPQAPAACVGPEYRAFDFWIGEWDAYDLSDNSLAGRSTITREDGGCVITEHWRSTANAPDAGYSGRSLNLYNRVTGKWEQFWVDSTGDLTHFIGGPTADGMQLTDPAKRRPNKPEAPPFQSRMTFTHNPDGTVRQHGQASLDGGVTWKERYDYLYKPHQAA